jgi:hypothetical protein
MARSLADRAALKAVSAREAVRISRNRTMSSGRAAGGGGRFLRDPTLEPLIC